MQTTTAITWFEIPAKDLERAVWFYESVLQQELQRSTMGLTAMAVFPHQEPGIGGALTHAPNMNPAADGSVIYLRTQRLEETLQRVTRAGGRVVLDKTALPDGLGVFAHILDCEGNRVGLHALD
jgi:predicted enzyme related to lactoylglutathione lyase